MASSQWLGHFPCSEVSSERIFQESDLALQHANVQHLSLPAGAALMKCRQDTDGAVETGHDVALGDANANRPTAWLAGDAHDAAHRLHDDVQRGALGVGACLAEAGDGAVDEAGI